MPLQKNSELCKGFSFIEFSTIEETKNAINEKNSSIPEEFLLISDKKAGQEYMRIITHK